MRARIKSLPCLCVAVLAFLASPARAQIAPLREDQGATGLGLALRRLPVSGRVLYVTAHPDDENNAALVALSRGRGLATALLTLTRGEGGQNAIGPELGEALGVLRTGELLAVHRYDGARQFFGAAYEFGFSFSLEETFAKWGHEETLGDVVRVVRGFRPDVILTLPTDAPDHQHHVAAARLAVEAFRAAADPTRFPEHAAAGLPAWQPRAVYAGSVGGDGGEMPAGKTVVVLRTGDFDPLLGMTWAEFGSLGRTMHKCQATRQLKVSPGEFAEARYVLEDAAPPLASPRDPLDGVDLSLRGLRRFAPGPEGSFLDAGLSALEAEVGRVLEAYDAREPQKTLPPLRRALTTLRELLRQIEAGALSAGARHELVHRLSTLEENLLGALTLAHGLVLEATSDDDDVVPGQTFGVSARVWNGGREPLRVDSVTIGVPGSGWNVTRASGEPAMVAPGQGLTLAYRVTVDAVARVTQPFWRRNPSRDRYDLVVPALQGEPFASPEVRVTLGYESDGIAARLERPAVFRSEGRWVGGERHKTVNVVPDLSVRLQPGVTVFPVSLTPQKRELRAIVRSNGKAAGEARVRLEAPKGWTVEPRDAALRFAGEGSESVARFFVAPAAGLAPREASLTAVVTRGGAAFREGYQTIAYDHVEDRHLFRPATSRALAVDVRTSPGVSVGYVMGVGDEVPDALRQLGLHVTLLSADDLAWGDLARFTTIVLGVRAYHARLDLRAHHARLMRWVEEGGHLVVQYHRGEFNPDPKAPSPWAPYPARVTTSRITDETAPMEALVARSPLLTTPNPIGPRDWEGWVQERAIQLFEAKDPHYVDVLAAADPFPKNAGRKTGLLVAARVGKGTWTYVGLVLFRELPAGVPGAYRLLANLVSRPRGR